MSSQAITESHSTPTATKQDAIDKSWEQYDQDERARRADPFYKLMDRWFIIGCWAVCLLGITTATYGG